MEESKVLDFKMKIRLGSAENAELFVKKCNDFNEDIDYQCGGERLVFDAKSLLGMLSARLNEVATVEIYTSNLKTIDRFKNEMSIWKVEE